MDAGEGAIEFAHELGMLHIHVPRSDRPLHEMIRYAQIEAYEPYIEETESSDKDKEPKLKEMGVKLQLVQGRDISGNDQNAKGLRAHPYIKREIKVGIG